MRALLPYLALYKRHKWMLLLGVVLAIVTLLASIGLLTLSGWFLSASAVVGVAGIYSFNYMLPAAGVRGAAIIRTAGRYFERLVIVFGGENAVSNRHTRGQLHFHDGATAVIADDFKMVGFATHHGTQGNQGIVRRCFFIGQALQHERNLQRTGYATHGNVLSTHAQLVQLIDGAGE